MRRKMLAAGPGSVWYFSSKGSLLDSVLQRSARRDPFSWLMGHGGDPIEILVVMPHDGITGLGGGGDDQVGDFDTAMMKCTTGGKPLLDVEGSVELFASAGELVKGHKLSRQLVVILS
jgi:hypothetical protein